MVTHHVSTAPAQRQRGFALLLTIVLVAFLVLILVGLASFTRVETQVASNSQQIAQARHNALMALNLAVGELQKNLGPDKRTSANAELVSSTFDTATNRATRNPYWVGAWNTEGGFRGWLVSGNENLPQSATPTTDVTTSSIVVTPLNIVSATPVTAEKPTGYTITTQSSVLPILPAVLLVGDHTIGSTGTAAQRAQRYVFAPVRDIQVPAASIPGLGATATQTPIGRYAWWVGDEGVKANLAAPVASLTSASIAERLKLLAGSPNRGFPTLGSSTPWERWSPDFIGAGQITNFAASQAKLFARKQLPLISGGLADEEKARFHEFTTVSLGVLSDSKNGGLRKDLSIAFEIPENSFKNSEFTRVLTAGEQPLAFATDHDSIRELAPGSNTPSSPTTPFPLFNYIADTVAAPGVPSANPFNGRFTKTAVNFRDEATWPPYDPLTVQVYRGPTFDQLRDHYQLYRRQTSPFTAAASVNAQPFYPNAPYTTLMGRSNDEENWVRGPWMAYFGQSWRSADTGNYRFAVTDTQEMFSTTSTQTQYVRIRPITTEMVPEVIRFSYCISIQSFKDPADLPDESRMRAFFHPFVVLHNPYNVVLKSPPLNIRLTRGEMKVEIIGPTPAESFAFNIGELVQNSLVSTRNSFSTRTADKNAFEAIDYYISDNGNTLTDPSSAPGDITLQPGEIRLYTIKGTTPTDVLGPNGFTNAAGRRVSMQAVPSGSPPDFSTGFYIYVNKRTTVTGTVPTIISSSDIITPFKMKDASTFTATGITTAQGIDGNSNRPPLGDRTNEWYLMTTKLVTPSFLNIDNNLIWPQIRQVKFYHNRWWLGKPTTPAAVTLTNAQIAAGVSGVNGPKWYVAKTDMYLRPANDGTGTDRNFSLITQNPRAMVQSPSTAGAQGPGSTRGPATWSGTIELLDGSTPGFDKRFWGTSTDLATGGQATIALYDIPRAPLTAIAAFQNANLSRLWTAPAYAVGNSYASPYIPSDRVWRSSSAVPGAAIGVTNQRYWNLDDSYIFNEALFDTYFFSGANPGLNSAGTAWNNPLANSSIFLGATDPTSAIPLKTQLDDWRLGTATPANPLLNPRLKFTLPTGRTTANATTDLDVTTAYTTAQTKLDDATDIRPHNAIAAYLLAQGSFNVNSISVDAWRTLLAGLRGAVVDHFSSPTTLSTDSSPTQTPFPRATLPGSNSLTGTDKSLWNGFRSLTDTQLNTLAIEIVTEIKARARNRPSSAAPRPFTTLGEFINRRLVVSSNPFGLKGALQSAIDRTINSNPSSLSGQTVISADTHWKSVKYPNPIIATEVETNTTNYDNPAALAAATIAGTPQWFSQADLLERVGPQLSARSDTFTVRTYGESLNPLTGVVQGRAWLEAIVQRETAYVNPVDHPALPISVVSADSQTFGRRFRVVSLRWLSPTDI